MTYFRQLWFQGWVGVFIFERTSFMNKLGQSAPSVVHWSSIGCGPKYSLSQLVVLSQLAAAGGEENSVCQAQVMSPALSEAVWTFYTRVLSAVVSEQRCVDWLENVWLGVKVYLTTLLGSERQTVPQPPHVASVICKGNQGSMRPDGWFHLVVI